MNEGAEAEASQRRVEPQERAQPGGAWEMEQSTHVVGRECGLHVQQEAIA
jgi:hypothetical protein